MNLTLEVISSNGQGLGPARRKVFGPEGGRIGRGPDCDWVLANPYISRHHATVRWISGTYYIESTGENGVAINTPQAMIPQRERRALKSGDRLFVDEYEITVGIGVGVAETPRPAAGGLMSFAPGDDPLGNLAATAQSPILADPLEPSHDELDPLKQLSGGVPGRAAPAARPEANWNHTPGLRDQFTPPAIPAGAIPDDWDKTSFGRGNAGAPGPSRSGAVTSGPVGGGSASIPDDWDKTSFGRPGSTGAAKPPGAAPRGSEQVAPLASGLGSAGARPGVSAPSGGAGATSGQFVPPLSALPGAPGSQPMPRSHGTPLPMRPVPLSQGPVQNPPAQQPLAQQIGSSAAGFDVTAFLQAAGVDPATVAPETAGALGRILRTVVQGVIEVLQARAELKNEFRLPLTRIRTAENNPLKFAVNAEDALNSLLGRRNPAYLAPVEAFEDAFDDIRFHQMAMLAGMRAGFEQALRRFDPQRLQEVFDKRVKRGGLLQMTTKPRYWELYAAEFRELTQDPDDAFKHLFGEVFAGAYEQQLEELKRSRRKPPR
jgi:type VI secretion system FHA domain protein